MFTNMLAIVLVLVGVSQVASQKNRFQLCESGHPDSKYLSCPQANQVITIVDAMYGRKSISICPRYNGGVTNCGTSSSFIKAKQLCNGKRFCTLKASNWVFGDPCWGVKKYLDVTYECVVHAGISFQICEKSGPKYKHLSCTEEYKTIRIVNAMFGRKSKSICPYFFSFFNTNCGSASSLTKAEELCNGKKTCTLRASVSMFGDPCWGMHKYLDVTYECVGEKPVKKVTYNIDVKTANVRSAGTDANVYIVIYGETGDTGKLMLTTSKTHGNKFEQNQLDSFTIEAADVGKITMMRVGHDNLGSNAGWYLDSVVVSVTSCKSTFSAWQWIENNKLEFDIYPTLEQGACADSTSSGSICKRDYRKIGCFSRDWSKVPDLLVTDLDPTHANYTTDMNWDNYAEGLHSLACRCRAKAIGHYKYFGIGFHAECVAGNNQAGLETMFAANKGTSSGCVNGNQETCDNNREVECAGVADYDFFYEIVE